MLLGRPETKDSFFGGVLKKRKTQKLIGMGCQFATTEQQVVMNSQKAVMDAQARLLLVYIRGCHECTNEAAIGVHTRLS